MSKLSNAFAHMREVVGGWAAKHHHAELLELRPGHLTATDLRPGPLERQAFPSLGSSL